MIMTVFECWLPNYNVDDFLYALNRLQTSEIDHEYLKVVTNVCHQHRCSSLFDL